MTFPSGRELEGRAALVTGSARNIGRAIALALAEAGAAVVVNARTSREDALATAGLIRDAGGRAEVVLADVGDPAAVPGLVESGVRALGRLDILVNNAAIRSDHAVADIGYAEWRRVTASILDASFLCAQAALPHLLGSDQAAIVNIGGVAGHVGIGNRVHVAAAKAGVAGLTRALAAELAASGVTVNCVSPGYIETRREGALPEHFRERPVPVGRPGTPEEVAAMVRHLAGPAARYVTGQVIHLNGGWHMGS